MNVVLFLQLFYCHGWKQHLNVHRFENHSPKKHFKYKETVHHTPDSRCCTSSCCSPSRSGTAASKVCQHVIWSWIPAWIIIRKLMHENRNYRQALCNYEVSPSRILRVTESWGSAQVFNVHKDKCLFVWVWRTKLPFKAFIYCMSRIT